MPKLTDTTAICRHCKITKNISNFTIKRANKNGHNTLCKPCNRLYKKTVYKQTPSVVINEKKCCGCKITKNKDEFYRKSNSATGYQSLCKLCSVKANTKNKRISRCKKILAESRLLEIDLEILRLNTMNATIRLELVGRMINNHF